METERPPYRTVHACRSCGRSQLVDVLSLGRLAVSNFVDEPGAADATPHPLELALCDVSRGGCGLVQLRHTVSPVKLYRNYWYRSGVNPSMTRELEGIAAVAQTISPLQSGDIVVDIGANDGTLLRAYRADRLRRVGFEPAENLVDYAREGTTKIFNEFFTWDLFRAGFGSERAKIVTAIAMFYDLDDPNDFVADVSQILDQEGVFIIQMSYLPLMLSQNAFDNICHEHLEYYALGSLERLLERHGLEVFDSELNDVNGGSFRVYIRRRGSSVGSERAGARERIAKLRAEEERLNLGGKKAYDEFTARVVSIRDTLRSFIESETAKGKRVYVYGASTKGNTLLQFANLDYRLIPAAAERNPAKWGKKTIATNIPIISEEQARSERPDYFLVLPWHFMDEFREREAEYLKSGGKLLAPMPKLKLISRDGEADLV